MRIPHREQLQLDATPIAQITLDIECRDPLIPILRGLQHLYSQLAWRDQALHIVAEDVLQELVQADPPTPAPAEPAGSAPAQAPRSQSLTAHLYRSEIQDFRGSTAGYICKPRGHCQKGSRDERKRNVRNSYPRCPAKNFDE